MLKDSGHGRRLSDNKVVMINEMSGLLIKQGRYGTRKGLGISDSELFQSYRGSIRYVLVDSTSHPIYTTSRACIDILLHV